MEIASIELHPYMVSAEDKKIKYKDNRRYTMRDIGALEKRIDELEEQTALNMLELNRQNINIYDSAGLNRFKSGIFVDNFVNDIGTDTLDSNYRSSRDEIKGEIRPDFRAYSVPLVYDSASSTNVRRVGDNIYIKYTHQLFVSQSRASRSIIVNPVGTQVMGGSLAMSPSSDVWYEDKDLPDKLVDGGAKISKNGRKYKNWDTSWRGITAEDANAYKVGEIIDQKTGVTAVTGSGEFHSGGTTTTTTTWKFTGSETVTESLGDKIVAKTEIKKMRSRFVSIRATGLRPNTKHYIFIDKTEVSGYASTASGTGGFVAEASLARDSIYRKMGKRWKNETGYPDCRTWWGNNTHY